MPWPSRWCRGINDRRRVRGEEALCGNRQFIHQDVRRTGLIVVHQITHLICGVRHPHASKGVDQATRRSGGSRRARNSVPATHAGINAHQPILTDHPSGRVVLGGGESAKCAENSFQIPAGQIHPHNASEVRATGTPNWALHSLRRCTPHHLWRRQRPVSTCPDIRHGSQRAVSHQGVP